MQSTHKHGGHQHFKQCTVRKHTGRNRCTRREQGTRDISQSFVCSPDPTRPLDDPTRRGGRHRACVSMPGMPFVRGSRGVEACEWFPRPLSVRSGLRIQHGCHWPSLRGRLCACTREVLGRCRVAVLMRVCEVRREHKGNDVMAVCFNLVSAWRALPFHRICTQN